MILLFIPVIYSNSWVDMNLQWNFDKLDDFGPPNKSNLSKCKSFLYMDIEMKNKKLF